MCACTSIHLQRMILINEGASWNSISIYEMEVYGGEPKVDIEEGISVDNSEKG